MSAFKNAGLVLGLVFSVSVASARTDLPAEDCGKGWVYFDIGNTLIDTTDWDHLKYMPQAQAYLHELKAAGFRVGLISNVPESWGATHEAKLEALKQEIAKTWIEPEAFEWQVFDEILLPPRDKDRKPGLFLFTQARTLHTSCKIAYEGEDAVEIRAAMAAGFDWTYIVSTQSTDGFFPPLDKIFARTAIAGRPANARD